MSMIKYGGTLTPSEALQANNKGEIPEGLHRAVCGTKFAARLAAEILDHPESPEKALAKVWLAGYGRSGNPIGRAAFKSQYFCKQKVGELTKGIPNLWSQSELMFVAAFVVVTNNPPAYYLQVLAKARPRNSRSREEWQAARAA